MNWRVDYQFSNHALILGESISITIHIENKENTSLYFSNFKINFNNKYFRLNQLSLLLLPFKTYSSVSQPFLIPNDLIKKTSFQITYGAYQENKGKWNYLGEFFSRCYYVQIIPKPIYSVFVSRGLDIEDRIVGDPIAQIIREWGLNTITIGIEVQEPIKRNIPERVKQEIIKSDAVIMIADPRFLDSNGAKKVFEWAESELGIGYGNKKPLLVIKENDVKLGGLTSYLTRYGQIPEIPFYRDNMAYLRQSLDYILPKFREVIKNKNWNDFSENAIDYLKKGIIGAGAAGVVYWLMGGFDQSSKDKKRKRKVKNKDNKI